MRESTPKNIIWVFGDQHRAQALGFRGDPNVHTPNLDRFASEGISFDNAVCGFPLCCPFRGSLLTGVYPHKCIPGHEYPLPDGQKTVAHAFKDAGYQTAYIGKWHADGWQERNGRAAFHIVPPARRGGFDMWLGYDNNNAQWDSWVHGHDADGNEVDLYRLPGYETDCLTDLLIGYLERQAGLKNEDKGAPFFAALSVQPPHDPYVAPEEFQQRYNAGSIQFRPNVPPVDHVRERAARELAGYSAQIANLDWNFGRVRQALSDLGLADDTLIVFFSDHGDMHGSHGQFRKTCPYEEAVRIPFIIGGLSRYQMSWNPGDALVNHVDIAPTSLGLAGIAVPDWMEGRDLSGNVLPGKDPVRPDSAYLQCVIPTGHGDSTDRAWRGIVTDDNWKYVCLEHQPWLMFNLNDDPCELANLAHNSSYRAERKRLHDRLAQWIDETGDTFALPQV